ncbi:src-like-adapter [Arapaima gigas]
MQSELHSAFWNAGTSKATRQESGEGTVCTNPLLKGEFTLVVLLDYPSSDAGELIFRVSEQLWVLSEEEGWWQVCSIVTENQSYIPKNHTAKVYHGGLFEGVGRQKAEELLQLPGHRAGSFMIRESMSEKGTYSLTVWNRCGKHYRIFCLPNGCYYTSSHMTFQSLKDLINYYSDSADDLCCVLSTPCLTFNANSNNHSVQPPPMVMRCNFNWNKVERSELINQKNLSCPDNRDSAISFGVRNSIAAYISLMELGSIKQKSNYKNSKSYKHPEELESMLNEEDSFQQHT